MAIVSAPIIIEDEVEVGEAMVTVSAAVAVIVIVMDMSISDSDRWICRFRQRHTMWRACRVDLRLDSLP